MGWTYHGCPRNIPTAFDCLRESLLPPDTKPWRTVRDALLDLPRAVVETFTPIQDHRYQPGAKPYAGHTGSPLDLPAKTLKAGDHGVPGGENMMVRDDGSVRYFSPRGKARASRPSPMAIKLHGTWTEAMRQIGNAVPVMLARYVAASVAQRLIEAEARNLAGRGKG
jgi:DNA (cytosine-5)-methyltransferase 1